MSLGLFAAGLAKGGIDTYSTLEDIERKRKESERQERALKMQETEFNQKQEERQALKDAADQTYGRVGKDALSGNLQNDAGIGAQQAQGLQVNSGDAAFDAADRAQLADTLRANAKAQGAAVPELPKYTREQAAKDYADRLYAIDPTKGQQAEAGALALKKGGLEVKGLERQASFDDRFDKVMGEIHKQSATRLTDIETTAQTGGMKGLVEKFGPELKQALGADVQLVGNNIVVKTKGQKPQTISSLDQAVQALQGAAQMEFGKNLETRLVSEGLFKSPQEMLTYFQNRREADRKDRDTDSMVEYRRTAGIKDLAAAGYYDRGGAAANKQTQGQILNEKIDAYATIMMKADPNLSRADADKRAAQVIMRDPEAKPEMTPADVNSFLKDQAGAVVRVDPNTKKPVRLGDLPLEEQLQIARQSLGRGGMPGAAGGGLPDVNPKAMQKPGAAAAPAQALPLTQRLAEAAQLDSQRTDKYNFRLLSDEVAKAAPAMEAQLKSLRTALPNVTNPDTRAKLEAQAAELERELEVVPGILAQRQALGF